ncbi:MAG: DUF5107 domain-containing protein, partial [Streptomyces sp.]
YAEAFDDLCQERRDDGVLWTSASAALGREAIGVLLAAGRRAAARGVWDRLPASTRAEGRFRLIEVQLLLAEGEKAAAKAIFDEGFEVADLREGAEVLGELWRAATDEEVPARYNYRMRAAPEE